MSSIVSEAKSSPKSLDEAISTLTLQDKSPQATPASSVVAPDTEASRVSGQDSNSICLVERLNGLRANLADIAKTVEIREYLQRSHRKEFDAPRNSHWRRTILADNRVFYNLQKEVEKAGDQITLEQLEKYEHTVQKLRYGTLSEAELVHEDEKDQEQQEDAAALFGNWTFGAAMSFIEDEHEETKAHRKPALEHL